MDGMEIYVSQAMDGSEGHLCLPGNGWMGWISKSPR